MQEAEASRAWWRHWRNSVASSLLAATVFVGCTSRVPEMESGDGAIPLEEKPSETSASAGAGDDKSASPEAAGSAAHPLRMPRPQGDCSDLFPGRPSAARLEAAVHAAADYLLRHGDDSGRFVYLADPGRDTADVTTQDAAAQGVERAGGSPSVAGHSAADPPQPHYNLLRHAGTIYSLGMYHQEYPRREVRETMVRAAGFLKEKALRTVQTERGPMLGILSTPELTGEPGPAEVKLGGLGLGLVALLATEKVAPGTTPATELAELGRFVLYLQKPGGGFYCKFVPSGPGRDDSWNSLYYPGEAALGLLMLYELDGQERWLRGATAALVHLADSRREQVFVPADHWALLATARLFDVARRERRTVPAELLSAHAAQICRAMLAQRPAYPQPGPAVGCLTADGRTCPTATRVEGMLAALAVLGADDERLRAEIATATSEAVAFLLRCQLREGPFAGGIPARASAGAAQPSSGEDGASRLIRVDYVQHGLSAMIGLQRWRAGDVE
jgi:hypothetical protein